MLGFFRVKKCECFHVFCAASHVIRSSVLHDELSKGQGLIGLEGVNFCIPCSISDIP